MRVPWSVRLLGAVAYRAWFTPPPLGTTTALRDAEAVAGLTAVTIPLPDGPEIHGYSVGEGPLVLALHGWGGRAAQMVPLAQRLSIEGMRVVAVDLPGHAGGEPTDGVRGAEAITAVIDHLGRPEVVVAHSFASVVMRLAFAEDVPPAIVMLAPLMRVTDALDVFADRAKLLPWTRRSVEDRLQRSYPELWPTLAGLNPDQFPDAEIVILHDPSDTDTPFAASAELAARRRGTTIVPIAGVGHSGVLSAAHVLEEVAAFVAEATRRPSSARVSGG